jgi:DNA-binding MarR family transcriptional regulator
VVHDPDRASGEDAHLEAGIETLALVWGRAQEALGTRVSPPQLRALAIVERYPEINVNGLAEALGAAPSSASRLCDRLAAAGLLSRVTSPHDRREVTLSLTRNGRQLLTELNEHRRRDLASVLERMSPGGQAALRQGLGEFVRVHGGAGVVAARDDPESSH